MVCDNTIIHISYKKTKNTIELFHCVSCNGIDSLELKERLIALVLQHVKNQGLKLIPSCPYVALYIMKNAEWRAYAIE